MTENLLFTLIKSYYDECLTQGQSLRDIMDTFKDDILPIEFHNHDKSSVKRLAQIIGTKLITEEYKQKQASI